MRFIALAVVCALEVVVAAGQSQKNCKDHGEYELYNDVAKDFSANNSSKALTDLERWSEKYPDSEFKDDRQMLYVQAYAGANQMAKAIDSAGVVLLKDHVPTDNSASVLRLLYVVVTGIQRVPDASGQQLAIAEKAAHVLETYDSAPDGVSASVWASTRADLRLSARAALVHIAVTPVARAMKANDCAGAEKSAMKAIQEFPESVQAAWFLATAEVCLAKADPAKASLALYELARAATLDPAKGMVDSKWQQANVVPYLSKAYAQFHGDDPQGLKELKELALLSPLPPAGFVIKSEAEIARAQEDDFESKHPELALWIKIKKALSASDGEHYFESELKDSAVPQLQGVLVEARPECRPTELRISIRLPKDTQNPSPDILLKLDKPLAGKPELSNEVHWTGVATSFSKEPFLLTMETEPSKIEGLDLSPCQPKPKKKTVPNRGR
jgi:hypothetical protein